LVWQRGENVLTAKSIMVSPDRRYKLIPEHTLQIRNIKPSDAGDYSCKISVLGDPIEITHTLEILGKSIINLFKRTRRRKIAKQFSDGAGVSL
jgi:hypothetical protein